MHILFLTDNFPPEGNAPATRTYEHAREWVKLGHKVTIITCAPNFPEGRVFDGYTNSWYRKETVEGIEVRRVKTYITANEGFVKRTLDFLSFMVVSFFTGLFVKKIDVVIGTSPQFFTVVSAWALSAVRFKPFIFELRDIWPASITAVGAMSDSVVIRMLEKLELFLYKRADLIVSVTYAFKRELVMRGVDTDKIKVILNGVDLNKYQPTLKDANLVKKYDLAEKFVAGYIGTHGLAQSLDTIVEAAELLKKEEGIVFLFAGGGAGTDLIKALAAEKHLTNVIVLGRQEKALMSKVWSLCDLSIVHLKDVPLFKGVIPSKMFESMGMGIPILIGVPEGEATSIISQSGCGIIVPPESSVEIAQTVLRLANSPVELNRLKKQAHTAAGDFDRTRLAIRMSNYIQEKIVRSI